MKKNLENLVEKFKKKETELLELLNQAEPIFDDSQGKSVIKKNLKTYILKVEKAKKIFEEYETLAKKIEDISSDDGDSAELSKTIVEFRQDVEANNEKLTSKEEKLDGDKSKGKSKASKKSKNEKMSVKEF